MSTKYYSEIVERSSELRKKFDDGLDEANKKMIDSYFFFELEVFLSNSVAFTQTTLPNMYLAPS